MEIASMRPRVATRSGPATLPVRASKYGAGVSSPINAASSAVAAACAATAASAARSAPAIALRATIAYDLALSSRARPRPLSPLQLSPQLSWRRCRRDLVLRARATRVALVAEMPRARLSGLSGLLLVAACVRAEVAEVGLDGEAAPALRELDYELISKCADGDAEDVARLLDAGADARAATADGETPMHVAGIAGKAAVVKLLAAAGADPDARVTAARGLRMTPLTWFAYGIHVDRPSGIKNVPTGPGFALAFEKTTSSSPTPQKRSKTDFVSPSSVGARRSTARRRSSTRARP